jgi:RimJ/RimL family protein N-acetyltransferase
MENHGVFTFRRALPSDKEQVSRLCAKIWDGDDYLPRCYDEWAADREGELALCFVEDRLAGISKLTWLAPGEAWLEGLRKDPDLNVKGVGAALCRRYLTRLAGEPALRSIRFSTYFANHASIKLNEALGFRCIATASFKELPSEVLKQRSEEPPVVNLRIKPVTDATAALDFVRASGWFDTFIHQAWRSYPWSEELFVRRYVEPGHCTGLFTEKGLQALAAALMDPTKGEGSLPFFDAVDETSGMQLLDHLEHRFARQGAPCAAAIVPAGGARARALLDTRGWKTWEREEDYWVYEFPLERLQDYR